MRKVLFQNDSFEQYNEWAQKDRKVLKKIAELIKDTLRHPFEGLGKPEPLKGNYKGYWSRRISDEHRLIYKVTDEFIIIASCKYHYED